ncbi:SUMF1/EgtB/PvdO family nonheme iron enzyme [Candidatus Poribacteria bacterium]|nr:SUMF1/EgtB/PvdO family nonheme iron enzyme [Candidatus Poribacteria bacterium]
MLDFEVGDVIAGRYEVKQVLGAGGMGKVYRARQVDLGRDVALKVPSAAVLESQEIMARFSREAKTVAKHTHDNIVQVYEYYCEEGLAFIAMEFVEGQDLKELTMYPPPDMKVRDMAMILEMSCEGLAHAHEHGIVHRDVKPHNIMVARLPRGKWRVKVMDFGIAHLDPNAQMTGMQEQLTQTGQALGTPSYMSPEQIRGTGVSALSDLYSMGCVIYFVFSRQTVFTGSGLTVAVSHLNDRPPSIRTSNPALPAEFDQVILRCLENGPALRPKHGSELGQQLMESLKGILDMPMSEVWRLAAGANEATIPIIQGGGPRPSSDATMTDGAAKLEEVQTQGTVQRTGGTGTPPVPIPAARREEAPPSRPAPSPAKTPTPGQAPPAEAPPKPDSGRRPKKIRIPWVPIGGFVAVCLAAGVVGGIVIANQKKDKNGNDSPAVMTPSPTPSPSPTPPGGGPTSTPLPVEPRATPAPVESMAPPTPALPAQHPKQGALTKYRGLIEGRAGDPAGLADLWSAVTGLLDPDDASFSESVWSVADTIALTMTKSPKLYPFAQGSFTMGTKSDGIDGPPHNVTLSAYEIGAYEVSALEFATFLNSGEEATIHFKPTDATNVMYDEQSHRWRPRNDRAFHPANGITWGAAVAYCEWLSSETGRDFHLPTEAQWERAARGQARGDYPFMGNTVDSRHANFNGTATVAMNSLSEASTIEGLFHMAGNVSEWCSDWSSGEPYPGSSETDPAGPAEGRRRIVRGGSFFTTDPDDLAVYSRAGMDPAKADVDVGFRLALSPP